LKRKENEFDACHHVLPKRPGSSFSSHIKTCALTHNGLARENNEDRYLINKMDDGYVLLAVADGMGGEVAGEQAAEMTMKKLACMQPGTMDMEGHLAFLTKDADAAIRTEVEKNALLEGMGTTVTSVLLGHGIAHWVHVGDSRLYILRDRKLTQVTKDQSMVQFLLDEGEITEEEAGSHHSRKFLDQCVGCGDCIPETGHFEIESKDIIVLTTDGLNGKVTNKVIRALLTSKMTIQTKADSLIRTALNANGKDDITLVIAEI